VPNYHDALFREVFQHPEVAAELLQETLPDQVVREVDWKSLQPQKDSFIGEKMEEYSADLLFRARICGKEGYLYLLFEHKSYPDPGALVQLLGYIVQIWRRKNPPGETELFPVLPLLVYQGKGSWNNPKQISGMIRGFEQFPEAIQQAQPNFRPFFIDLSHIPPDTIRKKGIAGVYLKLVHSILFDDWQDFVEESRKGFQMLEELETKELATQIMETMIRYILNVRSDMRWETVVDVIQDVSPERRDKMKTIAEDLIQRGVEKGLKQGLKEGMEKGLDEAKINSALEDLEKKGEVYKPRHHFVKPTKKH